MRDDWSEYFDPVERRLIRPDSFDYSPAPGSADYLIRRQRARNAAATSPGDFKKLPVEVRQMVWKEAAKKELEDRVVTLTEREDLQQDLALLPTKALSSPLLKVCKDSRAEFLRLVPVALEVIGCKKSGCNCTTPSGTLYINPATDIAAWFEDPYSGSRNREWFPGFCGHRRVKLPNDIGNSFQRLIAQSWVWVDGYSWKGTGRHPRAFSVLRMAPPYQFSSVSDLRYNTYEELICNGVDPESAEDQVNADPILYDDSVMDLTFEYECIHQRDLLHCLKNDSGPEFLELYRHCFYKNKRGDMPKNGDLFQSEKK